MKTLEENISESMDYVDFRIGQIQQLADERGVHITEVEDSFGKKLFGPWLKMKTDLTLALALHENTQAMDAWTIEDVVEAIRFEGFLDTADAEDALRILKERAKADELHGK